MRVIKIPSATPPYKIHGIASAARSDSTTLVLGETGAGKERVAQAIHQHSRRASKPFVPVDCAAIAENLWESELFGAMTPRKPDRPENDGATYWVRYRPES